MAAGYRLLAIGMSYETKKGCKLLESTELHKSRKMEEWSMDGG